jgi:hypothetical protein
MQIPELAYFRNALLMLIFFGCTGGALFHTASSSDCNARCVSDSLPIATEMAFSQANAKNREASVIRTISASQGESSAQQRAYVLSLKNNAEESLEQSLLEIRYSDLHPPHQRHQRDRHYPVCRKCNAPPAHRHITPPPRAV